jgi:hypothetical protein
VKKKVTKTCECASNQRSNFGSAGRRVNYQIREGRLAKREGKKNRNRNRRMKKRRKDGEEEEKEKGIGYFLDRNDL